MANKGESETVISGVFLDVFFWFEKNASYKLNALAHMNKDNPRCTFCGIEGRAERRERNIYEKLSENECYINLLPISRVVHLFFGL